MRHLILTIMIICFSFGSIGSTAQAARFGGGKSFGMHRTIAPNRTYNMGNSASRPAAAGNRWLGPLAGLAMGGLLASLFMGHGLGAGVMSWLLIGFAMFFIWRLLQGMQRTNQYRPQAVKNSDRASFNTIDGSFTSSAVNTPYAQFDESAFLRQVKALFIRLQAAYDHKNLSDLRSFCAPEVYAEIQLQLQERGEAANVTEVLAIEAELIDLDIKSDSIVASVSFTGQIREEQNDAPIEIRETWHFVQQKSNPQQWLVAGIQQS